MKQNAAKIERGELKVFTGNSNRPLARAIADSLDLELGRSVVSAFPDGETRVEIEENVRGEDVFVVQSTSRPTDHHLMEMLIIIDALRRSSASRITAVLPYYGYARQDRKDKSRVPITAKLVANLLVASGVSRVLTLDLHAQQIQGFFDIPVDHLYAAQVFYKYLKNRSFTRPVVVSPDAGGVNMAYAYARVLGAELAIVSKHRKNSKEVESLSLIGEVEGRTALVVDDLVTTGGTLALAARTLKEQGAGRVLACVTHFLLDREGFEHLRNSGIDELIVSDTVTPAPELLALKKSAVDETRAPGMVSASGGLDPEIGGIRITTLSVAELLGKAIRQIHDNSSVSTLFNETED